MLQQAVDCSDNSSDQGHHPYMEDKICILLCNCRDDIAHYAGAKKYSRIFSACSDNFRQLCSAFITDIFQSLLCIRCSVDNVAQLCTTGCSRASQIFDAAMQQYLKYVALLLTQHNPMPSHRGICSFSDVTHTTTKLWMLLSALAVMAMAC